MSACELFTVVYWPFECFRVVYGSILAIYEVKWVIGALFDVDLCSIAGSWRGVKWEAGRRARVVERRAMGVNIST